MHIGRLLLCGSNLNLASVFTPWMPRIADNAQFGYEVIQLVGAPIFSVEVLHKNRDDLSRDGGTPLSVSWGATSVGNTTMMTGTASGLKEMVRFHLILEFSGVSETEAVLYRFLDTTWFNAAG